MYFFKKDKLQVKCFVSRNEMGKTAALEVSQKINELLLEKEEINMIFAAAPSQNELLASLVSDKTIAWDRINAFHMDEYIGLGTYIDASFQSYLNEHIFGLVNFKSIHYINGETGNAETECERYANLLSKNEIDIVCLGIGENGHLAFNDPHVADFKDEKLVKIVELDDACRNQQVNDGCFPSFDEVPKSAITLTMPMLLSANYMFCVVPGKTKAEAVQKTINDQISERCPSTILREKEDAILYINSESAAFIQTEQFQDKKA
ncbi:MAG: glucosamine-6-phosphate deaminase [Thalassobius sp.]|nr:glucosamine-6-phosphate deaminase [Thalassovita sp.]